MTAGARPPPARVSGLRTLSILLAFTAAVGLVFGTDTELLIERNHRIVNGVCLDRRTPAFATSQERHQRNR